MKIHTLLSLLLCGLGSTAQSANTATVSDITIQPGCFFGTITPGELALSQSMTAMSTSYPGAKRPSFVVHVTHNAVVTLHGTSWYRDGLSIANIQTASSTLYTTAVSGFPQPSTFTVQHTMQTRTLYWDVVGTSATAFFDTGHYKATAQVSCI